MWQGVRLGARINTEKSFWWDDVESCQHLPDDKKWTWRGDTHWVPLVWSWTSTLDLHFMVNTEKILAMHNLQEPLQEKQKVVQWFFLCPITDLLFWLKAKQLSHWARASTNVYLLCYYQLVLALKYKSDMETRKWRQSGNVLINFYICLIFSNHLFLASNSII